MEGTWVLGIFFVIMGVVFIYLSGRIYLLSPTPSAVYLALGCVGIWTGGMEAGMSLFPSSSTPIPEAIVLGILTIFLCSLLTYGARKLGRRGSPLIFRTNF